MAKIYTKNGDKGETGLVGGTLISKSHELINLYGRVDELNSHIGMATVLISKEFTTESDFLKIIQSNLFSLGSLFACEESKRESFKLPQVDMTLVSLMEQNIDKMTADLPELKNFILPGGTIEATQVDICRSMCRNVERLLVGYVEESKDKDIMATIPFINRLSDYFFSLSRFINFKLGAKESIWNPK